MKNKEIIYKAYCDYTQHVSTKDMAISFETSIFIYNMAISIDPKFILDTGSGFSSYILRFYATNYNNHISIITIDDHPEWLNKTYIFLAKYGLQTKNMMLWNDFKSKIGNYKFDFIFHDLGKMDIRKESFPYLLKALDKKGIYILDDLHVKNYCKYVMDEVHINKKLELCLLKEKTLDEYGRFAGMIHLRDCS